MTALPPEPTARARYWIPWEAVALGAILTLGGILRFVALDRAPLWWDEGNNAYFAQASLDNLLRLSRLTLDTDPPAHRLALKGWVTLFGASALSLRSLSAACGLLTVGLVYLWGRSQYGAKAGLWAAALSAAWPVALYYQREAKAYAWVMLFACLSAYLWWKYLDTAPRWRPWPWLGAWLSAVLALGAHYYAVLFIAAQGVGLVTILAFQRASPRQVLKRLGRWASVQVAATLVISPWVFLTFGASWRGAVRLPEVAGDDPLALARQILGVLAVGDGARPWAIWLAAAALLASVLAAFWRRTQRENAILLLALALVPPAFGLLVQQIIPFVPARFFLFVLPPLAVLAGAGLAHLGRWAVFPLLGLAIAWGASLPLAYRPHAAPGEDLRPIGQTLRQEARPGDGLLVTYIWEEGILRMVAPELPITYHLGWFAQETVGQEMAQLFGVHPRLWVLSYQVPVQDPANTGAWWLEHHAARALYEEHPPYSLALYLKPQTPQMRLASPVGFEGGIRLEGFALPEAAKAGEAFGVALEWVATEVPAPGPTVFLHLVDGQGTLQAQQDGWPHNGLLPFAAIPQGEPLLDMRALRLRAEAPPGEYRVLVGLYDPQSGRRYPIVEGEQAGEEVFTLGTVRITSPDAD